MNLKAVFLALEGALPVGEMERLIRLQRAICTSIPGA